MIIEVLAADLGSTVGAGIIAPTENTCVWNIRREKVTEPVDIVYCPGLFTVSIKSVYCNDTMIKR